MFGENCTESCGNCLKSEQCHHINGTCMKGCDRGYQGFNCTEGKFSSIVETSFAKNNLRLIIARIFEWFMIFGIIVMIQWHIVSWITTLLFLKECDEFHNGFSCNETCNVNCKGCDRTTGECQNGCNPGWTGNHCQEGDMFSFFYQFKSMFDTILTKKSRIPFPVISRLSFTKQTTPYHSFKHYVISYNSKTMPSHLYLAFIPFTLIVKMFEK